MLALGCAPHLGRISRNRARPGDGTEEAAVAARSPSEVKVRRVGTGCARIHFFDLVLDFFFPLPGRRSARHQFPCMRRRPSQPSLHSRLARYLLVVHRTRFSPLLPLALFLSFSLSSSLHRACRTCVMCMNTHASASLISARTHAHTHAHVCGTDGTLADSSP